MCRTGRRIGLAWRSPADHDACSAWRPVDSRAVTLYEHTSHEVRCDLCDKPKQNGETDVITFFAGEENGESIMKSADVCRDCRARPIEDLLAKLTDLGAIFGVRRSTESA